ncbi:MULTISPECIES: hypothetical protein [unclassified Frondihabitans]|uniref:hypothetical protein n=1 Tax=unclassified Frondihabitans TaxID=2626248 RepID=UPI000F50DBE4|nr:MULTISPECIES: hypothetical protein [unclassified Frondihabitans]RPE76054.1 hypothetical protein EDF37_1872 [Frondihabitans sp. PhB153]RPF05670.1 hypothetical protein EDF39_2377 [Frondihabitans sp. PhB161]
MENDLMVSRSGARSSATFSIKTTRESLPALISEVIRTSRRFKLKAARADGATLTVGFTWRVWAGVIELSFAPVQGGWAEVEASWRPTVTTTVIDYGQGAKDLRRLYKELLAASER